MSNVNFPIHDVGLLRRVYQKIDSMPASQRGDAVIRFYDAFIGARPTEAASPTITRAILDVLELGKDRLNGHMVNAAIGLFGSFRADGVKTYGQIAEEHKADSDFIRVDF